MNPTNTLLRWTFAFAMSISCVNAAEPMEAGIINPHYLDTSEYDINPLTDPLSTVLQLVNEARKSGYRCPGGSGQSLAPLVRDSRLDRAAAIHSQDMVTRNFFSHIGSDGSSPFDRITRQGYRWSAAGENIAAGYRTPQEVMKTWLESPGHCANIMNSQFTQIGLGMATGGFYKFYWTQDFGKPRS